MLNCGVLPSTCGDAAAKVQGQALEGFEANGEHPEICGWRSTSRPAEDSTDHWRRRRRRCLRREGSRPDEEADYGVISNTVPKLPAKAAAE
jgi:hypothetical protein